jgi:amidohydrolase
VTGPTQGDVAAVWAEFATRVEGLVAGLSGELVGLRRRLHAHPEVSGAEVATTAAVTDRLRSAGLRPIGLGSGTGLVCDVRESETEDSLAGTPYVVLRADIDALAMPDGKDVSYRSQVPGVAHACGHDVHTVVVLGAGLVLAQLEEDVGRVRLVFEPREETVPGGAVEVIEEGWLAGAGAIFGVHCNPKLDVGRLGLRVGPITSASDLVELHLHGPGGHTARPQLTVDLVAVAGRVATQLQDALARRLEGGEIIRMVFGAVRAGNAANVIPAEAMLRGTLRTPSPEVWARARDLLEAALADVLDGTGATWDLDYRRGVPAVVNDEAAAHLFAAAGRAVLGADAVGGTEHSMGGDSFAWYLEQVPGAYARLGVHDPAATGPLLDLHASTFDVDEKCIGHGVRLLVLTALAANRRLRNTRHL